MARACLSAKRPWGSQPHRSVHIAQHPSLTKSHHVALLTNFNHHGRPGVHRFAQQDNSEAKRFNISPHYYTTISRCARSCLLLIDNGRTRNLCMRPAAHAQLVQCLQASRDTSNNVLDLAQAQSGDAFFVAGSVRSITSTK